MKDGWSRRCDRCGVLLTKANNKCGFELCDTCNDWLEEYVKEKDNESDFSNSLGADQRTDGKGK